MAKEFDDRFILYGLDINKAEYGEYISLKKHLFYHNTGVEIPQLGVKKFNEYWDDFWELEPMNGYTREAVLEHFEKCRQYFPPDS